LLTRPGQGRYMDLPDASNFDTLIVL
jgi:hypothetical protein